MLRVNFVLGLTDHAGIRLAEVGFLLIAIAGAWVVAADVRRLRLRAVRTTVAGFLLAAGGVLLIIATHWGHFG